jgi:hypothetical protein
MRFERTTDADLVKAIVTHPQIWPKITDDNAGSPEDWQPSMSDAAWYVLIWDDEDLLGLWAFFPENSVTWKAHICFLPDAYGRSKWATMELFDWIWHTTECQRIIGEIAWSNRLALRMVISAGCVPFGIDSASFLKNGILEDRVAVGISRPVSNS